MWTNTILTAILTVIFLSGCGTIVRKTVDPILGLATKDAATALQWVEANKEYLEAQGVYELAKACPETVISLQAAKQATLGENIEGFKGLIYHGLIAKYGKDRLENHAVAMVDACRTLIPWEEIIR